MRKFYLIMRPFVFFQVVYGGSFVALAFLLASKYSFVIPRDYYLIGIFATQAVSSVVYAGVSISEYFTLKAQRRKNLRALIRDYISNNGKNDMKIIGKSK